jgi:hypothetical protein
LNLFKELASLVVMYSKLSRDSVGPKEALKNCTMLSANGGLLAEYLAACYA